MHTVVATFPHSNDARSAVQELIQCGFDRQTISVVEHRKDGQPETMPETNEEAAADSRGKTGAMIGGAAGLLAGAGAVLVAPISGPIVVAGALLSALTGLTGGALIGGLVGGLMGWGVHEEEATRYAEAVRAGHTLLVVRTDDARAEEASRILHHHRTTGVTDKAGDVPLADLSADSPPAASTGGPPA